jgi:hypothetical protein
MDWRKIIILSSLSTVNIVVTMGPNNKWIGTALIQGFMVSPDGQETKYHFTTNNSRTKMKAIIIDIDINSSVTGEVLYFCKEGLDAFKGVLRNQSK